MTRFTRPKFDQRLTVQVDQGLLDKLDELTVRFSATRSDVVRRIVVEAYNDQSREDTRGKSQKQINDENAERAEAAAHAQRMAKPLDFNGHPWAPVPLDITSEDWRVLFDDNRQPYYKNITTTRIVDPRHELQDPLDPVYVDVGPMVTRGDLMRWVEANPPPHIAFPGRNLRVD